MSTGNYDKWQVKIVLKVFTKTSVTIRFFKTAQDIKVGIKSHFSETDLSEVEAP
jgi:hypothetical protein